MSDINFHKPYRGREDNRYTFKIQKLYEYQYLLQEITKKLQKILKQKPEYKNKNKATINSEINEITNTYYENKKDFSFILHKFYEMKAKGEPLDIDKLFSLRFVLIKLIETLQRSIGRLPVPQNNNNKRLSNNLEENNNEPLPRFRPKSETKNMTEKEKLKMIRKEAEKSRSKKRDSNNLQKIGTYSKKNNENSRSFLDAIKAREFKNLSQEEVESALRAIRNLENRQISFGNFANSNNNSNTISSISRNNNTNSINNYRPRWVSTINGNQVLLSAREARNYNNGNWEAIIPYQNPFHRNRRVNRNNSSTSSNLSPLSPLSNISNKVNL
jgi:hypothetical protein